MCDCALLACSSLNSLKTTYLYEFRPRTRKLERFRCSLKPRIFGNELLMANCGNFQKSYSLSNSDRIGQFINRGSERNIGEMDRLKLNCNLENPNLGSFSPGNYDFRFNLKQRSYRNAILGKTDNRNSLKSLNAYNSKWTGDNNGEIRFNSGSFGRNEDELQSLSGGNVDQILGLSRPEKYNLFDKVVTEKEENALQVEKYNEEEVEKICLNSTTVPEMNEKVFGRKLAIGGIDFGDEDKEESLHGDSSVSSNFDFLELKNDLEKDKTTATCLGALEDEDLVPKQGSRGSYSKSEEVAEFVGRSELRNRRQLLRRSNMLAKQVISMQSALSLGFVSQLWVDTRSWMVLLVEVRPSFLSGEMERFLLKDVGDVVLVQDESVMENDLKMIGLDTLVGYNVVTPGRGNVGKVRGYTFDINSGSVELLELDPFGISIIPSSLVSTYGLFVEDVLEVTSDTVVMHEDAASHVQRLTKGFWDARNVETSRDEVGGYFDRESRSARPRSSRKGFGGRKVQQKMKETKDDWELPMDY
ncbi:uncharacterized protein LOC143849909 isoform X2 [Tasmannia lanceolata]|uniref:uncharacterized protein LOC143849909 isoform X2 n=1 Tax=Tasmannia lanceolata TaxID=3420 RepID=UPI004062FEBE